MIVDILLLGLISAFLAWVLNKIYFNKHPASSLVAWSLTLTYWFVSIFVASAFKFLRHVEISNSLGIQISTNNVIDMPTAALMAYAFWQVLNRASKKRAATEGNARVAKASTNTGSDAYTVIANEIESGNLNKALWTRLYAEHDGDEPKTRAAYIRERVSEFSAIESSRATMPKPQVGVVLATSSSLKNRAILVSGSVLICAVVWYLVKGFDANSGSISIAADSSLVCQRHLDCPSTPPMLCDLDTKRCVNVGSRPSKLDELFPERPNTAAIELQDANGQLVQCRSASMPSDGNPNSKPQTWNKFIAEVDQCMKKYGYRVAKEKYKCTTGAEDCYVKALR